jgi:glycosyltransferase involved in cell wall biosynthesis
MKIVFLAPFGIRPKGTLIARMLPLAVELQALGHQVVIVAPPYTNPEDSGRVETVNGVTIKNIQLGPRNKILIVPFLAGRMFRAAMSERPDIVHLFKPKGYGGFSALLLLALKRLGMNMPLLLVDTDDWEGKGGMNELHSYSAAERVVFRLQEDLLLPRAAAVTVASRTLQTKVWGMGTLPERVLYLPNCVEDIPAGDGAAVREKLGICAETPVVLLYTRFFEFSQDKLHSICAEIWRQIPEVRFLVVGAGRNGEESLLAAYCQSHGFSSALMMAGWLEPPEIPSYLAAADVALYPFSDTLVNRSKCPAKLTEILRAGVPVVADNVGQLAEYVKPGVSGVLCDPDNWQEMADGAVRLLLDRATGRQLGAAGRNYLLKTYNWKTYAAKLHGMYRILVDSDGSSIEGTNS